MVKTLKSKAKKKHKYLTDWTDYDESRLFSITSDYYREKGIEAFSLVHSKDIIPSDSTNSYPHAESLVILLKNHLHHFAPSEEVKVLECGLGSGLFSYNFLKAAEKHGVLDRIRYIMSDFESKSLTQIKEKKVFDKYADRVEYLVLDLLNVDNARLLDGSHYDLNNLALVMGNYVLDALPMIPIRKSKVKIGSLEKVQIRLSHNDNFKGEMDILDNTSLLKQLRVEERFMIYKPHEAKDIQKQYLGLLESYVNNYDVNAPYVFRYSYGSLKAVDSLMDRLHDKGLIYLADMPVDELKSYSYYYIYGNAVANTISYNLIRNLATEKQGSSLLGASPHLARLLISKDENLLSNSSSVKGYIEEFIKLNPVNLFTDLTNMILGIQSKETFPVLKILLDELRKIDCDSALFSILQADYHEKLGNPGKALDSLKLAKSKDILGMYRIDANIARLASRVEVG